MATRTWAVIKKHVPLIKFRSGLSASNKTAVEEKVAAVPVEATSPVKAKNMVQSFLVEDWQLASRFKRKPLSPEEIDCINNGGVL